MGETEKGCATKICEVIMYSQPLDKATESEHLKALARTKGKHLVIIDTVLVSKLIQLRKDLDKKISYFADHMPSDVMPWIDGNIISKHEEIVTQPEDTLIYLKLDRPKTTDQKSLSVRWIIDLNSNVVVCWEHGNKSRAHKFALEMGKWLNGFFSRKKIDRVEYYSVKRDEELMAVIYDICFVMGALKMPPVYEKDSACKWSAITGRSSVVATVCRIYFNIKQQFNPFKPGNVISPDVGFTTLNNYFKYVSDSNPMECTSDLATLRYYRCLTCAERKRKMEEWYNGYFRDSLLYFMTDVNLKQANYFYELTLNFYANFCKKRSKMNFKKCWGERMGTHLYSSLHDGSNVSESIFWFLDRLDFENRVKLLKWYKGILKSKNVRKKK